MNFKQLFEPIQNIILLTGGIETLGYFSESMADSFYDLGYHVFLFDLQTMDHTEELTHFVSSGPTALITFNFIGLSNEDIFETDSSLSYWDLHQILCFNILVDHPFYYYDHLLKKPSRYIQCCIDHFHCTYMRRFYPDITPMPFLPLAGTPQEDPLLPFKDRPIDVLFTGNYTPPSTFDSYITRLGDDYALFYRAIIDDLLINPHQNIDTVMEHHIIKELGEISAEDKKKCMRNMIFIDLYVRFFYRGKVIRTLIDNGITVHVFGSGWDKLECSHPENLILGGLVDSAECIRQMRRSKLSLNIMPWFKDGAHDRVFNSMLHGALCVTDPSAYLSAEFTDHKEAIFYTLTDLDSLPSQITALLHNASLCTQITTEAFKKCLSRHTWSHRAHSIHTILTDLTS
ncbi:MAG: glycosyltransferase family 1 protein [Lachnospiraceae bacterium]|nr:glycosyltransferase family 1 protein [Lachnospiraceae bacterium]